jgi:hypothetical protein
VGSAGACGRLRRRWICIYLLDLLLVPLLEAGDVAGSLLGLLDFLPGLHLLLLQKGDSVRQQLGVPLDAA